MTFSIKPLAAAITLHSALLIASQAHADSALEGRLIDARSQSIYSGAVVRIEELNREVLTSNGGLFRMPSIAAGEYTLNVLIGGQLVESRKITLVDGEITNTSILLNEGSNSVEEVLVVGQAAGMQKALDRQRHADGIISAVNADAIGELPDNNAAEALQRIPGLSVERDQGEGRFIRIRGMGADLNSVSINGTEIPAPEAGVRAVALDVIPSNLIRSMVVTKTLTADMDANAIGGAVEIEGISALDRQGPFYNADVTYSYDEHTSNNNPKLAVAGGTSRDLGKDSRLGVAAALSYESRDFGSDNVETGGAWSDGELESLEERDYTINRERKGAAVNIDYQQDANNSYYLRTLYSEFTDDEQRQAIVTEFQQWDEDEEEYSASGRAAGETGHAEVARELKDRLETQKILAATLGGEHYLNDWTAEYQLGLSKSQEDEPDTISGAAFVGEFDNVGYNSTRKPRLTAPAGLYDNSNYELDEIERNKGFTDDRMKMASVDLTRDLIINDYSGFAKFGGKIKRRDKKNDRSTWVYDDFGDNSTSLGDYSGSSVDYSLNHFGQSISASSVRNLINSLDRESAYDADASWIEDYNISEDINAAYLMGQIDIDELRLTTGVRHERTRIESEGYALNADGDIIAVGQSNHYSHTLPSLLARYELDDSTQIRAAWTNTLARPTFEQIRPNYEINAKKAKLETGNPELEAMRSGNLDLGIEHFSGSAGAVSAFVFHKNIHNFIYETDLGESGAYTNLGDFESVKTFMNGDTAKVMGLELAASQKLIMLPEPFDGLLISANVTLVDTDARITGYDGTDRLSRDISLPNQSDLTGNLVIGYETDRLSLRLATNYKSEYLTEIGNLEDSSEDIHQASQTQVDFNAAYKMTEQMKLRFEIANLTDEPYYTYQGSEQYNAQYEEYGPTYSLGISYSSF